MRELTCVSIRPRRHIPLALSLPSVCLSISDPYVPSPPPCPIPLLSGIAVDPTVGTLVEPNEFVPNPLFNTQRGRQRPTDRRTYGRTHSRPGWAGQSPSERASPLICPISRNSPRPSTSPPPSSSSARRHLVFGALYYAQLHVESAY